MSQIGKLYRYYLEKIWQKNWLRIIIFAILVGAVWWFVIPWVTKETAKKAFVSRSTNEEIREEINEQTTISQLGRYGFGNWGLDEIRKKNRELLEDETKFKEELKKKRITEGSWDEKFFRWALKTSDSANLVGLSFPFTADNAFFFSQTEGYNNMKEKSFWKLLNDISWWNLSSFIVLYWFIFIVFDKLFFPQQKEGEEMTVLTLTPGVKRSDLLWGKILAFLTFYFLINIFLFLIPFSVYYWWLASNKSLFWFSLLSLWSIIIVPLLFFGLIFATYLFFGSISESTRWIVSTLLVSFPIIWGAIKTFTSVSWIKTVESTFFHPVWFPIISLLCGIFFLTLYYFKYQEEDLG